MEKTRCRHCEKVIWYGAAGWAHELNRIRCIRRRGESYAEPILTPFQTLCLKALLPWEWRSLDDVILRTGGTSGGVSQALAALERKHLVERKGGPPKERRYRTEPGSPLK